ncbi:MAG: hypothetical protein QQN63_14720, partial [Nitrosopumilus sp.]
EKIRIALQSAKREDRILIHLDGMVLDMDDVNHKVDELKREFKDKFRRIDVYSRLEPLIFPRNSGHPVKNYIMIQDEVFYEKQSKEKVLDRV